MLQEPENRCGGKRTLVATLTLIGTIIGVGVFGLPYTFAVAGVNIGIIWFLILSAAILLTHLYYGEVVSASSEEHRLVGFAAKYLGKKAAIAATVCSVLSFYGAILAYIIVGGQFLYNLFGNILGGTVGLYQVVFFILVAVFVAFGLKMVSEIESVLTALLVLTMIIITWVAFKNGSADNFTSSNWSEFFLPYGVIFFAITGSNAIPEIKDIVGGDKKSLSRSIIWGSLISFALTLVFTLAVVAVSGVFTSSESLFGLGENLGPGIILFGSIFGFLAIITSFLVIGVNLKEQFIYDFGMGKFIAWALACIPPFLIYLFGTTDAIKIMGLTGSVLSGFIGIIIIALYLKVLREKKIKSRLKFFAPFLILLFIFGIVYEIAYLSY